MKIPRRLYLDPNPLPLWQALVGNVFESALNLDAFLIHLANPDRRRSKTDTTWGTVADLLQQHPELAADWLKALERLAWVVKTLHAEPAPADPAVVAAKAEQARAVEDGLKTFFTSVEAR
jgi:hypothetical protein